MHRAIPASLLLIATVIHPLGGQTPADEEQMHLTKARTLAGTAFFTTEETQCNELAEDDPYHPADKEKDVAPTRVFDNVFFLGTTHDGAWVVKTSQGIILINALHSDAVKSVLLPGFKKLGLDPADVKYVIVSQAAGDEYGGARYFQEKYSAQVIMSPDDWDELARIVANRPNRSGNRGSDTTGGGGSRRGGGGGGGGGMGGGRGGFGGGRGGGGFGGGRGGGGGGGYGRGGGGGRDNNPSASGSADAMPQRDQEAIDGQTFTLGDETVTVLSTPMHTSGTLTVLVPVVDHGQTHLAAILGGTAIPLSSGMKTTYITSAVHLAKVADSVHVDVELNSHPFVDNAVARMDTLRRATADAQNPFVIGPDGFQRFMGVISECGWVNLLRPAHQTE